MNRRAFLDKLKLVSLGLSKTGIIEQSDYFIVRNGTILANNDEMCVRTKCPELGEFAGAIPGTVLVKLIQSLPDEELEVDVSKAPDAFVVKAESNSKKVSIKCEQVKLTVAVPKSGEWFEIPDWLIDVIVEASKCCNNDQLSGASTCVHIGPGCVESCDNTRLYRRVGETQFPGDFYLHCSVAMQLRGVEIASASISGGWCHFRTKGAQISVRGRDFSKFPDLKSVLKFEGSKVQLPDSLSTAVDRCAIMSDSDGGVQLVKLTVDSESLKIISRGTSGWYRETMEMPAGQKLAKPAVFSINPDSLGEILKYKEPVLIGETRMRVAIGGGYYCCALELADAAAAE